MGTKKSKAGRALCEGGERQKGAQRGEKQGGPPG